MASICPVFKWLGCPVFKWHLKTRPFGLQSLFNHLNTRPVRYSDLHCINAVELHQKIYLSLQLQNDLAYQNHDIVVRQIILAKVWTFFADGEIPFFVGASEEPGVVEVGSLGIVRLLAAQPDPEEIVRLLPFIQNLEMRQKSFWTLLVAWGNNYTSYLNTGH